MSAWVRARFTPALVPEQPGSVRASPPPPTQYFALYETTARAVLAVDALLSVGGPATAGLAWVSDFVNFTSGGTRVPASFVSTHSYPTDLRHGVYNRTTFEEEVIAASVIAGAAGLPLVLTETSAGLNNAYDAPFAGAFVAHIAAAFLGVPNVPTLSFWTVSAGVTDSQSQVLSTRAS